MNRLQVSVPRFRATPLLIALAILCSAQLVSAAGSEQSVDPLLGSYVLIGWNDLGMHCSNKDFADLAVLPPFNTIWATLLRRGSEGIPPEIVEAGFRVDYHFPDNTYSVGKTDFWSYEDQLFGVDLPDNVGLTGKGLSGEMDPAGGSFVADGIPLTPFDDADLVHEQPFQIAQLEAFDDMGTLVAATEIVAPVSNEMMCSNCHHPEGGETVEQAILRVHDEENGTNLMGNRPVLCADCHGSNALGLPGNPDLKNLSLAIHDGHKEMTNDCYQCHPGPNTQCLRGVMADHYGMTCQDCHGSILDVVESIEAGREPWFEEPRCEDCHGASFAEAPGTLYRNSNNGHGGLYCTTCHNSPHAILPSREERDNRQNVALQGYAGTLDKCSVCHGTTPAGAGPHGYYPTGLMSPIDPADAVAQVRVAPNPMNGSTEIRYRVIGSEPIHLAIYDAAGRVVKTLTTRPQTPGDHTLVWDGRDGAAKPVPAGVYFCRLETGGHSASSRLIKLDP